MGTSPYDPKVRYVSVAEAHGVPAERVLREDEARYTIENALFVRRLLDQRPTRVGTVALVTSSFHMERSRLIFSAVLTRPGDARELPSCPGGVVAGLSDHLAECAEVLLRAGGIPYQRSSRCCCCCC